MPNKICPQCNATHGARKLVCDCGHDFGCKRTGRVAIQAEPTEPTAPTVSTEPTALTVPTEPTAPTVPTEPTESTELTEPTESTEPTEPTEEPARRRGRKICSQCNATHGARKLVCDCGHDFACKRTGKAAVKVGQAPHPLYPEPGGWVLDKTKGMPDILPPEPLPSGLVDAATVRDHVAYEGLGYVIYSFIPAERISDPELRRLWREARAAMQKVVEYLEQTEINPTD